MPNTETPAVTLDTADLSQSDYRLLREGGDVSRLSISSAADAVMLDAETADVTDTPETTSEVTKQEPKPKTDKLNARFSELTAKIRTLETQLSAKSGTGQTEKPVAPAAAVVVPPPDPSDLEPDAAKFADYVEWQKSWIKWNNRQDARETAAAAAVATRQSEAKTKADSWQSRVSEAAAEFEDFATVAQNPDLPVTRAMGEAITDSEIGPKILYHLGSHPEEAKRIAALSPVAQVREIGRLEAALDVAEPVEDEDAPEPQTKKPVSKAPAPHRPVGGSASVNPSKQIETMTQAEYRAYRESGKIR